MAEGGFPYDKKFEAFIIEELVRSPLVDDIEESVHQSELVIRTVSQMQMSAVTGSLVAASLLRYLNFHFII